MGPGHSRRHCPRALLPPESPQARTSGAPPQPAVTHAGTFVAVHADDDLGPVDLLGEIRAALDDVGTLVADRVVDIEMSRLRVSADASSLRLEIARLVAAAV